MRLTAIERKIMRGVWRDLVRLSGPAAVPRGLPWHAHCRAAMRAAEAREDGLVPVALGRWLGHQPSPAEFCRACRAYARLERRGLAVRRCPWGAGWRATHLEPTPAGKALAEKLARPRGRRLVAEIPEAATVTTTA